MIKEITAYKIEDGTIFEDEEEAYRKDFLHRFRIWYMDHKLLGNIEGSHVKVFDLEEWLTEYRSWVMDYISHIKE